MDSRRMESRSHQLKDGQTTHEVEVLVRLLQDALLDAQAARHFTATAIVSALATVLMRAAVASVELSLSAHATHNRNIILGGLARISEAVAGTHVAGEEKEIVN